MFDVGEAYGTLCAESVIAKFHDKEIKNLLGVSLPSRMSESKHLTKRGFEPETVKSFNVPRSIQNDSGSRLG